MNENRRLNTRWKVEAVEIVKRLLFILMLVIPYVLFTSMDDESYLTSCAGLGLAYVQGSSTPDDDDHPHESCLVSPFNKVQPVRELFSLSRDGAPIENCLALRHAFVLLM